MDQVKVEDVAREVIKPISPSPQDRLQLSILDLTVPAMYVSTIFFYKAEDLVTLSSQEIISKKLKTSLSKTLSRFYPLAGRVEGVSIKCNDEGAVFHEARTDLLLSDFMRNLNTDSLKEFLPTTAPGDSPAEWPLLSVKVTFFGSGSGVAISVSASHRICDAASLLTFVTDWATTTAIGKSKLSTLHFAETTIYPPLPPPSPPISSQSPSTDSDVKLRRKCVTNRFVFESSKISELKRKAVNESVLVPTRVEVITSLIWKCARNASRSNLLAPRSTVMFQSMDLRPRLPSTVLPLDAIGNLQTVFFLKKDAESEMEICETVVAFRKTKEGLNEMIKENLEGDNTLGQSLLSVMGNLASEYKPDIDIYIMSSWCGKPFYEVDFGWGSPVWMGSGSHTIYDDMVCVVLIDSKDGEGVEAWVSLSEQDMSIFVHDQELLDFAVLNPPVLI